MKKLVLIILWLPLMLWGRDYAPREVLCKTTVPLTMEGRQTSVAGLNSLLQSAGLGKLKQICRDETGYWYKITTVSEPDWPSLRNLRSLPGGVISIQPNYLNHFNTVPNDPYYSSQQCALTNLPSAWDLTTGNGQVVVAIIDSGIAFDHPDLQNNIWINEQEIPDNGIDDDNNGYIDDYRGWDFTDAPEMSDEALGDYTDQDNDPSDENWHGTHVAGIIGADTDNHIGICGTCWQLKMMILRAGFRVSSSSSGYLQDDDVSAAIIYATDNGAAIINASWGDTNYSQIIADACRYAYSHGVIIVAAAGNSSTSGLNYPARLDQVISVTSVNSDLSLSSFSSYGPELDFVAPGNDILSAWDPSSEVYLSQSGSSMAAPVVAGAIALYLGLHPQADFQEVYTALASTAQDLGDDGFDNYFGFGLLDARAFLAYDGNTDLKITSPEDLKTVSVNTDENGQEGFDIIGSAHTKDFFRYSLAYASAGVNSSGEWRDVYTHVSTPDFHFSPVFADTLARFLIPPGFADGDYLLRLTMESKYGSSWQRVLHFNLSRQAPIMNDSLLYAMQRWNNENNYWYIQSSFNQEVQLSIDFADAAGQTVTVYANQSGASHMVKVPDSLSPGPVSLCLHAVNAAGLTYDSDWFTDFFVYTNNSIPMVGYDETPVAPAQVFARSWRDRDNDNCPEILGMKFENAAQGDLAAYEVNGDALTLDHSFTEQLWPRDWGNSNAGGLEVVGTRGTRMVLYESVPDSLPYPNFAVFDTTEVYGCRFGDYNNDNLDDLISVRGQGSTRVISMMHRTGLTGSGSWHTDHTIYDTTPTDTRNTFVPTTLLADFDGNDFKELVTADTDGDVMVYEIYNNASYSLKWTARMPLPNTYLLANGDFDGDGTMDLCVGGYNQNTQYPEKSFWYFGFYHPVGSLTNWEQFGQLMFDNVGSNNTIYPINLDADAAQELVLTLSPNLYVIDYVNGSFVPVYRSTASYNYQPVGVDYSHTPRPYFFINDVRSDSLQCYMVKKEGEWQGPDTPGNFVATAQSGSMVHLSWTNSGAAYYQLLRRHDDIATVLLTTAQTTVDDNTVIAGQTYEYQVIACDPSLTISQSRPTPWKSVTPVDPPSLAGHPVCVALTRVKVLFNSRLANNSTHVGHWIMNQGIGQPLSANFISDQCGVLLTYASPLSHNQNYTITINDLAGSTGVLAASFSSAVDMRVDNTAPRVVSVTLYNDNQVLVHFSEAMDPVSAGDITRYTVVFPSVDIRNSLTAVQLTDSLAVLTFATKLQPTNQQYFLQLAPMYDLAGNVIANDGSRISFRLTDIKGLRYVKVVPNPLNINKLSGFRFINLPLEKSGNLRIYDLAGQLVYQKDFAALTQNSNELLWDCRNQVKRKVASGVYFYILKMGNDRKTGKLAIVR